MKDAMTDHKAEWVLVPRVATPEMLRAGFLTGSNELHVDQPADAPGLVWEAMIAAAPAASEGEDGAVDADWPLPCDVHLPPATTITKGCRLGTLLESLRMRAEPSGVEGADLDGLNTVITEMHTRPAAQVAASLKHDEGRVDPHPVCEVQGCVTAVGGGPECKGGCLLMAKTAIATQPAARRVTDADVFKACADYTIALSKCGSRLGSRSPHEIAMRTALESFAQPAEGVSGGNG